MYVYHVLTTRSAVAKEWFRAPIVNQTLRRGSESFLLLTKLLIQLSS